MFIWESHHAGGCWSAVGRVPGFIDSEYTAFQNILETGAPSGWQVVGFGTDCGGDTGNAHYLYFQLQSISHRIPTVKLLSPNSWHWLIAEVKNVNLNVTQVLVSDFKNAFSRIFNFTVRILSLHHLRPV